MVFLALPCKRKAGDSIEIFHQLQISQSGIVEHFENGLTLIISHLEGDQTSGIQEVRTTGAEGAEEVESIGSSEKGHLGVVEDFRFEGLAFGFGDVGEVGDDDVEGAFDFREKIAVDELG